MARAAPPEREMSRGFALWLVALSAFGFSVQALVVKTISNQTSLPTMETVFFRGCSQLLGCFTVLSFHGPMRRHPRSWLGESLTEVKFLTARGAIGFLGIMFGFQAVTMISLGEMQVVNTVTPVFSAVYARLFLGEPWLVMERIAACVALAGVILQFQGDSGFSHDRRHTLGLACALAGSASAGGAHVLVRFLGTRVKVDWVILMEYQALGQVFLSGLALRALGQHAVTLQTLRQPKVILLLVACGMLGFLSQIAMTRGMQKVKSASSGLIRLSGLPWSFLFQAVATPDVLKLRTILGALVVCSAMLIVLCSHRAAAPQGAVIPPAASSNKSDKSATYARLGGDDDDDDDDDDDASGLEMPAFVDSEKQQHEHAPSRTADEEDDDDGAASPSSSPEPPLGHRPMALSRATVLV